MNAPTKLGLVLSGGGAKGAYQVGILKYLAETRTQCDMVSGTSIGALNAAVVSSERDIANAAAVLESVWHKMQEIEPLQINGKKLIQSLEPLLILIPQARVLWLRKLLSTKSINQVVSTIDDLKAAFSEDYRNSVEYKENLKRRDEGVMQDQPLIDILNDHAPTDKLKNGLPLYVGVYASDGSGIDFLSYINQLLGGKGKDSDFIHIQSLREVDMHDAIMASAALPWLFHARPVEGKLYRDGGMGGVTDQQGNTPLQPLYENGCTHAIVSLLEDGSTFNRHAFKKMAIIEVRPKTFISDNMLDMVAFKSDKISQWMEQGYEDARRCIGNSLNALAGVNALANSSTLRDRALNQDVPQMLAKLDALDKGQE